MTHSRKSAAQRAKSLERLRAFRERTVTFTTAARTHAARPAPPPPQSPFDNYEAISTPEAASWPDDETGYSRYMVWKLPVHELTHAPRRAYTPRLTPNT